MSREQRKEQRKDKRGIITNYNNTKEEEYFVEVLTTEGNKKLVKKTDIVDTSKFITLLGTIPGSPVLNPIEMQSFISYNNNDLVPKSYVDNVIANVTAKVINVTYTQLNNLKNTNSLVVGQVYKLTDYRSRYIQPVTGVLKTSITTEPLYITAVGTNKLHNVCKSEKYPQDIVFYEITGDIGNGAGLEGFDRGKIYRRIDTKLNNDIGTDWRHIKYDRDGVDKFLFNLYGDTIYNNIITPNTVTYFNLVVVNRYFFNNKINVIVCQGTTITSGLNSSQAVCNNNITATSFTNNTILHTFSSNNIICTTFNVNTIGTDFKNNKICGDFYLNTISDGFSYNTIDILHTNIIGFNFSYNKICYMLRNSYIGDSSRYNIFHYDIAGIGTLATPIITNNTEFKTKTFLMANPVIATPLISDEYINLTIYQLPNNTRKYRYYDNTNTLITGNL